MPNTDTPITIHQLIIHKVDHKNAAEPQLADVDSPTTDPDVLNFLRRQITNNREHKYARSAAFVDPPPKSVSLQTMCDALLDKPREFVAQSRDIATHLFNSSKQNTSIGDLVVCSFSEGADRKTRWLALLKMDPEDGFVGRRTGPKGKVQIILEKVQDVLPSGDLQKCAFILPKELRNKQRGDLRVLDQQQKRFGVNIIAASFFTKDFLQCKINLNAEDRTSKFLYASESWVERKKSTWPATDVSRFKERSREVLSDEQVDLTEFAKEVIPDEGEQDTYLEFMAEQGIEDLVFKPDPKVRERETSFAYFEGADGLQVRINADAVGPDKALSVNYSQRSNLYTITIRTPSWEPKLKSGR